MWSAIRRFSFPDGSYKLVERPSTKVCLPLIIVVSSIISFGMICIHAGFAGNIFFYPLRETFLYLLNSDKTISSRSIKILFRLHFSDLNPSFFRLLQSEIRLIMDKLSSLWIIYKKNIIVRTVQISIIKMYLNSFLQVGNSFGMYICSWLRISNDV